MVKLEALSRPGLRKTGSATAVRRTERRRRRRLRRETRSRRGGRARQFRRESGPCRWRRASRCRSLRARRVRFQPAGGVTWARAPGAKSATQGGEIVGSELGVGGRRREWIGRAEERVRRYEVRERSGCCSSRWVGSETVRARKRRGRGEGVVAGAIGTGACA